VNQKRVLTVVRALGRRWKAVAAGGAAIALLRSRRRKRNEEDEAAHPHATPREATAARLIGLFFFLSAAAGVALLAIYALGGQPQLEGLLLGVALGGIGIGLILWGRELFPAEVVTEERGPHGSEPVDRAAAERILESGERSVTRRRFLSRLLGAALGAFAVAMVFPIRSLGPRPRRSLFHTAWTPGTRLVDETGVPVRADTLQIGGVVTVFPEGRTNSSDSQAIVVRLLPDQLQLPAGRESWAPDGNVCYSKLCTHAGCPVGLYVKALQELQCPCHQSSFDVRNGAQVVFGPASRPLPQLPLDVDSDGYLVARSDFNEPVGPGFWNSGIP
jgi:ubiquinol-cytochrome c reductase iron-sulfur subunit